MKKILAVIILFALTTQYYSQKANKMDSVKKDVRVFTEFSPFLAAFKLVSIGAGIEISHYQIGVSFTKGDHHFSHALSKTTFENFGDLHFLHNQSEEIFVKRYFKSNRKGLYVGGLLNLTHWQVENHDEGVYKNIVGKYLTFYSGYRWFLLSKTNNVFYFEPNFGVSARLNGREHTEVGNQSFTFLQPPFELTPNIYMGARFRIGSKKTKM